MSPFDRVKPHVVWRIKNPLVSPPVAVIRRDYAAIEKRRMRHAGFPPNPR
jgi:hypothetical protein